MVEVSEERTIAQDDLAGAFASYQRLTGFLRDLAEEKAGTPGDDLISRLAVEHWSTGAITLDELVGVARLVLVAGHETTTNQLALSVLSLLLDDELRGTVLADPDTLIPNYVEESMRYWSISQDAILRMATEDLDLGGVVVRSGESVVISIPAANHDPEVFSCPARIDVHRDPSAHLQWGIGPHRCQGAPLAAAEMQIALRSLFKRFPGLALGTDDVDSLFRRGTVFHGVESLPVTW